MSFDTAPDTQEKPKRKYTIGRRAARISLRPPADMPPKPKRKTRTYNFEGFRQYNKGPKIKRPCLGCGHDFNSNGKHNRLCIKCKSEG